MKLDFQKSFDMGKGMILSPHFVLSLLIVIAVLVSCFPIRSFDVWWHLAAGKWMVQHHKIVRTDPFSFLHYSKEWIDCAWLFQLLIYVLYRIGGFAILLFGKMIVILAIFLVMYLTSRNLLMQFSTVYESSVDDDVFKIFSSLVLLFSILYFSLSALDRFFVRPHLLSYLFVVWVLYVMLVFDKFPKLALSLFPLSILWVNTHGSFPLEVFIVSCFALDFFLMKDIKRFSYLVFLSLLLLVAFMVNPFSYYIWKVVFSHVQAGDALYFIKEWRGVSLWSLLDLRHNTVGKISFFIFWFGVIFYVCKWRRFYVLLLSGVFFYMCIRHHRFYPLWILVSFPFVFVSLMYLLRLYPSFRLLLVVVVMALCLCLSSRIDFAIVEGKVDRKLYPEGISFFVKKLGLKGRMFNPYAYGGYLIWQLYPDVKVFIDGRTPTVYSSDDFFFYRMALRSPKVFRRLVDRYRINLVLLKRKSKLFQCMLKDKNWIFVDFDQVGMLFVRKEVLKDGLETYALENLNIDAFSIQRSNLGDPKTLYNKLLSLDKIYPRCGDYKILIGICLYAMGDSNGAESWFKKALRFATSRADAYYNLGILKLELGENKKACYYLQKAIEYGDRSSSTFFLIAKCYYFIGEYEKSVEFFDKYITRTGLMADKDAYWYSGIALYKLRMYEEALSRFRRFSFLVEDPSTAYYNMGNCYFALNRLKKAAICYLKALKLKSNYADAVYNLWKTYEAMGNTEMAVKYRRLYNRLKNH